MTLRTILLITMSSLALPSAARAAVITNLDDKPHAVDIKTGQGYRTETIQPGSTWREAGDATVRFNGQETRIESYQEFAIWSGGTFGPQKFRRRALH